MQDAWADATLQLKPHGEKIDVVILSDVDELTTRVDDSVVTMGNILASPHVGPIRLEAEEFAGNLNLLQVRGRQSEGRENVPNVVDRPVTGGRVH